MSFVACKTYVSFLLGGTSHCWHIEWMFFKISSEVILYAL